MRSRNPHVDLFIISPISRSNSKRTILIYSHIPFFMQRIETRKLLVQLFRERPAVLAALDPHFDPQNSSETAFIKAAAAAAQVGRSTVRRLIKGEGSSPKKSPNSVAKQQRLARANHLKSLLRKNPLAPASRLRALGNLPCSVRTVRRDLTQLGLVWRMRARAQRLKEGDTSARVQAARRLARININTICFSDEARVTTNETCRRGQWVTRGAKTTPLHQEQYPPCFLLWGVIGVGVKQLIILPQTQCVVEDGEKTGAKKAFRLCDDTYIRKILTPSKAVLRGKVFQQDGARCHWTARVKQWFVANEVKVFQPWPARSPDLNPIEKVWSILKAAVSERRCTDLQSLQVAIEECWAAIPQAVIDRTVRGVKSCANACQVERGKLFGRKRIRVRAGAAKKSKSAGGPKKLPVRGVKRRT
jgi:transposase